MTWSSRYRSLSLSRLWLNDFAHFAARVPTVGGTTVIQIADVVAARRSCQPLIGWGAIIAKAIALNAKKWPELRQCYMPLPWPHAYEHPHCVASFMIEREWEGKAAVFFDRIHQVEERPLREIDARLRAMKGAKIESLGGFRLMLRISRYPLPLRRLLWSMALKGSGRLRARYFGLFSINSIASRHSQTTQTLTLQASSWYYEPAKPDGSMSLQVFFDHRVIDGAAVRRMVSDVEKTLNSVIVAELRAGG